MQWYCFTLNNNREKNQGCSLSSDWIWANHHLHFYFCISVLECPKTVLYHTYAMSHIPFCAWSRKRVRDSCEFQVAKIKLWGTESDRLLLTRQIYSERRDHDGMNGPLFWCHQFSLSTKLTCDPTWQVKKRKCCYICTWLPMHRAAHK